MAKKKTNHEGTIVKRSDGRYMARYTLDGKRYAVYGASYKDVKARMNETLSNIEKGEHVTPSGYTLAKWMREWLPTYALPNVKQSTYISYESYARLHLEPTLGSHKLTELTIEKFQRLFNDKKKELSAKSLFRNCLLIRMAI